MKKPNKFKLYRDKTLVVSCYQIQAANMARTDALKELSQSRNPTYLMVGHFNGIEEQARMGKLTRGRIYWKFATPPKKRN